MAPSLGDFFGSALFPRRHLSALRGARGRAQAQPPFSHIRLGNGGALTAVARALVAGAALLAVGLRIGPVSSVAWAAAASTCSASMSTLLLGPSWAVVVRLLRTLARARRFAATLPGERPLRCVGERSSLPTDRPFTQRFCALVAGFGSFAITVSPKTHTGHW